MQLKKKTDERTVTDKKGRVRTREVAIKEPRPKKPAVEGGPGGGGGGYGGGGGGSCCCSCRCAAGGC